MNSKTNADEPSRSPHGYAAILERAKATVDQWDKHDQYRQTEADAALNDDRIGEPDDVAIARTLLDVHKHFESFTGFAATTRRENTYDWMCLFLDWLNGVTTRLDPDAWFDIVGADHFVLRRMKRD